MSNNKILIAVSDTKSKEHFSSIFKLTNYNIHYADATGNAAEIFSSLTPDIIISDIEFTEWFFGQLKQTNLRELPIICYIKEYNARLAYDLLKKGAYDCITDPLRPVEVIDIVNKSLSKDVLAFEKINPQTLFDYFAALPSKNKISLIAGVIGAVALFSLLAYKITRPAPPKQNISVPHYNVTGIIAGEQTIFLSDWSTQAIYRYGRTRGELVDVYYFSDFGPLGIAADGNVIWSIGTDQKIRMHMLKASAAKKLETIKTIPVDIATPSGICIENKNLWVTDSQSNKIYVYEISQQSRREETLLVGGQALKFKAEYTTGNLSPSGIWKAGENIFIIDAASGALFSGVISENRFIPRKEYSVKKPDEKVIAIGGAEGGESIFMVVSGVNGVSGAKTVVKSIPLKKLK